MKRIRAKTKNKSKPKRAKAKKASIAKRKREKRQGVRSLRGKYKHLDLMKGLIDARKEERKSERIHSKAKKTKSRANGRHVVKEAAPIYRVLHQHDLFETEESNGQRLGYSPAYGKPAFTAFRSVTPETNLSSLNLNWREVDLPEKERTKHVHRLHPYLGKFIPQLVEIFLRKFRPKAVYDPFAGSGTTLVEAKALGIDSVGCDVSAFNCLLMKVKTVIYDLRKLEREIRDILERLNKALTSSLFGEKVSSIETESDYLKRWFHPNALAELLLFRELLQEYEYSDALKVILSRSARSARLTTHFDLDFPKRPQTEPYYCYKHARTCEPTQDALQFLNRYALDTLNRIKEFSRVARPNKTLILHKDARFADLPKFDLAITSPPYVGLIDYHEQHRYAYELLGLPFQAEHEIGAAFKGHSAKAKKNYCEEIGEVFTNVRRHLKPRGHVVIVVNDKDDLYDYLAGRTGFVVEGRLKRHVNRRTGRRSGDFFEEVLIWKAND
jgi:hypothetical protein